MTTGKKALGRGLSALLGSDFETIDVNKDFSAKNFQIDMSLIEVNPYQPRVVFKDEELQELSESIKKYGVVQPILVRRKGSKYQLIAGERRLQASRRAGLSTIPAVVREMDDQKMFEVAIIENVQRENLDPIEEAEAYIKLMEKYSYTQEKLAEVMGKSRSYIANLVRILKLPKFVKSMLANKQISIGHAKILVNLENAEKVAKDIVEQGMSVHSLQQSLSNAGLVGDSVISRKREIKKKKQDNAANRVAENQNIPSVKEGNNMSSLAEALANSTGCNVIMSDPDDSGKGEILIRYSNLEELDDLMRRLGSQNLNF